MSVNFDTSEVGKLADDLGKAGGMVNRASSATLTAVAAQFRDDAKAAAPVDTGALKDSIRIQGGKDYRVIKAEARHAFFVEFGTGDTAPQPFMWPQVPAAARALMDGLGDAGADVL